MTKVISIASGRMTRDHQRGAQIAEKQHQQHDHEHDGLDQHFLHREHRLLDQVAAVVEHHDLGVFRQPRLESPRTSA